MPKSLRLAADAFFRRNDQCSTFMGRVNGTVYVVHRDGTYYTA